MLNGFTTETAPLSYSEKNLIPPFVTFLENARGKDNAVTNRDLQALGYHLPSVRVRKIINHIRTNNLVPCLVASNKGYYIAETEQELLDYEESLTGRANEILRVRDKIAEQRMERYDPKQLSLF